MITKHRVSNDISTRVETDAAPPLIHLRERENTFHKVTEARSGERTNIGDVFDAPPPYLPVHTKTNVENYKKYGGGFSFVSACWHLPSPGASAGFTLACPPPPLSTVALNPSTETRGRSRRSRTHRPFRIMAVSPLSSRCWHLPSTGGLAYFLLDSHPPPPSTVAPAPYPETRGRSIIRRTPRPCCLLIFTLAWRRQ